MWASLIQLKQLFVISENQGSPWWLDHHELALVKGIGAIQVGQARDRAMFEVPLPSVWRLARRALQNPAAR
jgi:hypothetical protein